MAVKKKTNANKQVKKVDEKKSISVSEFEQLRRWGDFAFKSGLVPKDTNALQAMAIIQAGKEMGLQPLQSLRMMSFVRGRLCMSVQLQLAMAKQHGIKLASVEEGDGFCKVILTNTKTDETITTKYTKEDATKAGLVKPDSNWYKYEKQMLRWRAIGDALRLLSPNSIMGLLSPEEAHSIGGIEEVMPLDVETVEQPSLVPDEAKGGD